jgi:hypothetical protein
VETSRSSQARAGNQHIAWFQPLLGSYQTSGLAYRGHYYTLLDRGFLLCHDAATGKQVYGRQRLDVSAQRICCLALGIQR